MSLPPPPLPPAQPAYPQPPSSRARCENGPDGAVRVTIPPILGRPLGKIILVAAIAVLVLSATLLARGASIAALDLRFVSFILLAVSSTVLAITLWMGFRSTIIEADAAGLHLELRGLFSTRRRFWPRAQITGLRKGVSLYILGPGGVSLGKIDATDPREERWLMSTLAQALNVPVHAAL